MQRQRSPAAGITAAQFHSFARSMPIYYASVVTMLLAVVYVFYNLAPRWLSCCVPLSASLLGIYRGIWWTRHKTDHIDDLAASHHLRRATRTLIASAIVVVAMDLKLATYGDVHARYFIIIQLLASAMCGFYCLMHLRAAAFTVFGAVMLPFVVLAISVHHTSVAIAAANSVIAAGVMIIVMLGYQRDFISLVQAKADTLQLSQENLRLAHLDVLTGLPNRRHFFDMLEIMQRQIKTSGGSLAVGVIDLDGFKPINDTYGHRMGDRVLGEIGLRLQELSSDVLHLSRLGGDEFAFFASHTEPDALHALGQSIMAMVSRPVHVDSRITSVGCSIGFACCSNDSPTEDLTLFEQADYALYHSKRTGRARTTLFSEEHATLLKQQGLIEQTLRHASLDQEFFSVFQPIVNTRSKTTMAFECLARWNSPVLGNVSPAVFVPAAEHSGIIGELTLVLLRKALETARTWPEHIRLSFNVSPHEIGSLERTQAITDIILESGISPERVAIELTETALLKNFSETNAHMALIRATGATISLDDFGTGHSSLSYVHALSLDTIKVDQSFVRDIDSNRASRNIVRSVINLCRDLKMSCVIEGVETESQLKIVEELGGLLVQGYFFSRPMPGDAIPDFLARKEPLQPLPAKPHPALRSTVAAPPAIATQVESCQRRSLS